MFNFGSFISLSKNILIMACVALVIYGISLLVKLIMTKTGATKIWDDYVGKYWTCGVFVISAIVYCIICACKHYQDAFVNGIMNALLLTALETLMFRIVKTIIDFFKKITNKSEKSAS
jgi:membrane-anchored glycerophosphoryl diester phosphodiesterase (GDPDase)